ncbi:MAG: RluA family pseudouridine synthase [Erysipelotrichaceae bacterium]|nr:RluA family pseudouridine synthase [Erysipelotrichaceae bacterium]
MPEKFFRLEEIDNGERIDSWLAENTEFSRSRIRKMIDNGDLLVNGEAVKANHRCQEGEEVLLRYEEEVPLNVLPEDIPLDILYEDDDLLVINKPKGMVVHPGAGNHEHTLVNALMHHSVSLSSVNGAFRPGIVHRIDKDTSGLLVCAKNDQAHLQLADQLKDKRCFRRYYTLVHGVLPYDEGEIDAPIGRDPKDRQKMCVTAKNSKEALTLFHVLKRFDDSSLLSCELKTGRTHQIRVHLSYIGYPVINDPKYSRKKLIDDSGQYLHAYYLSFLHPRSGERMEFETGLPEYFEEYIARKEQGHE